MSMSHTKRVLVHTNSTSLETFSLFINWNWFFCLEFRQDGFSSEISVGGRLAYNVIIGTCSCWSIPRLQI